jgi:hypothetical protein
MDSKNCFYNAQGALMCQAQPLYIDTTGVLRGKPHTTTFWDSVPSIEKNPICLSDLPCCTVKQEEKIINQDIFCKPDWCCNKN